MTSNDFVKVQAVLQAWREGHPDGINAMLGILHVIKRRADKGGGDWIKVIWELNQQAYGDGLCTFPDSRDPDLQTVLYLVDGIYDGTTIDRLTNEALFYGRHNIKALERTAQIGQLMFFK